MSTYENILISAEGSNVYVCGQIGQVNMANNEEYSLYLEMNRLKYLFGTIVAAAFPFSRSIILDDF